MYTYNVPEKICKIQLSLPHYIWNFEVFWWFFFFCTLMYWYPAVLIHDQPTFSFHASPFFRLPWWLRQKRICLQCRRAGFDPKVGKIPWRRTWQTHSSIFAWRIPWTEEPGGLQCMGSQRVGNDWKTNIFRVLLKTVLWVANNNESGLTHRCNQFAISGLGHC